MDDFLNEDEEFPRRQRPNTTPYMVRLVLATGFVSSEHAAKYTLLGVALFALIAALFIIPSLFGPQPSKPIIRPEIPISPSI